MMLSSRIRTVAGVVSVLAGGAVSSGAHAYKVDSYFHPNEAWSCACANGSGISFFTASRETAKEKCAQFCNEPVSNGRFYLGQQEVLGESPDELAAQGIYVLKTPHHQAIGNVISACNYPAAQCSIPQNSVRELIQFAFPDARGACNQWVAKYCPSGKPNCVASLSNTFTLLDYTR
ncbi:hypothetical protein POL68_09055 [Stigmatella sp. ncwal1]|uniref:Uncharacterized protein n=1 Tax=Stigmatella ashevillensis TaxID=2995309 RepID=A0ABT5D4L9_9BACT|nr:hypothetical protein [Stigmatella ashevillena]MDC0708614.1 hypothetical protein [Stigmatella ashevillena]